MTDPLDPLPIPAPASRPRPPESLEELRALALAIARGQAQVSLGPRARAALGQLLELSGHPALLSITTLAEHLGVNPSTLTRLAHALGYSGFPGLQRALLSDALMAPGLFYARQAEGAIQAGSDTRAAVSRLARESQANIGCFVDRFDEAAFETAVRMIMEAPRVVAHGIRQFHAMASFLVYGLRMIRSDVTLLDANNLGIAEGLAAMGPGDVLVSVSCRPYSALVIEAATVARERGVGTVVFTDLASSPLVETSQAAILVGHQSSFISNSIGAFMVAAECLINACAAHSPDQTRAALQRRAEMIRRLGIEV
ncbi:transcriptional regulator, RpiR family [Paracoccus thiocyanatus]|uniref:Transcriptional regulator, RpiR family n=1 Tax=Paracoccus thiocyanatus TaxID=34006 RepID=A0A1N6P247_9RHOB|nr:MurR/RpiR family transcriptional regulator [Paracoccus thiocyanatus]SIP98415.1 transcriptional regulator, RpiR family [Paracoccus thiocyanatus]